MTSTSAEHVTTHRAGIAAADRSAPTPTDRLLDATLVVAPLLYLVADTTYAARGWDDPTAGVFHVLGAIAYGFVVVRVLTWLAPESRLRAWLLLTGLIGMAGNVAYGFETIHMSLGDVQLVDQPGAANLIKPLGLFFPLSFLLVAAAVKQLGARWQAALIVVATLLWPVAHIGNVAAVAVPVNLALTVAFGTLAWERARRGGVVPSRARA